MTARVWLLGGCLVLAAATDAMAQTRTPAPGNPPAPKREREFSIGGAFAGPASMGSADALLLGPSGNPSLTLFTTHNKIAAGFGADVALGFHIRRALWFEVSGGLLKANVSSRISDDFENAPGVTISSPATRFSVEGALLWYLREQGKTSWFVRAGAGLMREIETSSDFPQAASGVIAEGGVGFRYWRRTNGKGTFPRVGLRAEVRGVLRAGGISLGSRALTFGPAGTVHLVFGY